MAKRIKNKAELQKIIRDAAKVSVAHFAEKIADEYRNNIETMWYDTYDPNPESYERTYQLLDSVSIENTNNGSLVYLDTDKIRLYAEHPEWNAHMGWDGEEVENLPKMLNDGTQGNPMGNNPRAEYAGGFIDETNDWIKSELKHVIRDELEQNLGISASVRVGGVGRISGSIPFRQSGIRIKI